MKVTILPSAVKGNLKAPASKSVMQRVCAAALLCGGETVVRNPGASADDRAAMDIVSQLGATLDQPAPDVLRITAPGTWSAKEGLVLDCGESGLALRMFTPIASLSPAAITLNGRGSLLRRPLDFIGQVLEQAGVSVALTRGMLPLTVRGPLQPATIRMDGSLTSQLLSGLLMACSALGGDMAIHVTQLKSKPYIDLTLKIMEDFGMRLPDNNDYRSFVFTTGPSRIKASRSVTVEGDWSGAAFLLVAGAIAGHVTVEGLDVFTAQADKKILEALQDCGCRLSIRADAIEVAHQPLKAFHFDATDCPDLIPPLTALAACCEGTTVLEGADRLVHKESDRTQTLISEFTKLGIDISTQDNKLIIRGGLPAAASLSTHNDHRIAMACGVAALRAQDAVTIDGADAVHKSYPAFWDDLARISVISQPLIS